MLKKKKNAKAKKRSCAVLSVLAFLAYCTAASLIKLKEANEARNR